MSSPCPAKVMLHQLLHAYCTSSEHGTSVPCVLCFSSLNGRHPIKRWRGNDIWLNGLRLTLPGCTLTIMGNVRGLHSQLSADAVLRFFTEFTIKKRYFLVNCVFQITKWKLLFLKSEPKKILNICLSNYIWYKCIAHHFFYSCDSLRI